MKERDGVPKPVQIELTSEALNPTLIAGDIFMANEAKETQNPQEQTPHAASVAGVESGIGKALQIYHDKSMPVGLRKASGEYLSQQGLFPVIEGGAGLNPLDDQAKEWLGAHVDESQPLQMGQAEEEMFLRNGITKEVIDANRGTPRVLYELLRNRRVLEEQSEVLKRQQENQGEGGNQGSMQEQYLQEMLASSGEFSESRIALPSKDIPLTQTYDYVDPETGETKVGTISNKYSNVDSIMREGETATRRNIKRGKEAVNVARIELNTHISTIEQSENYTEIRSATNAFIKDIESIIYTISENEKELLNFSVNMGKLRKIEGEDGLPADKLRDRIFEIKAIVKIFSPYMRAHYHELEGKMEDMPKSLEDLVRLARSREEGEFKEGGTKDLLEKVKVIDSDGTERWEERANLAHFYEWVRHQMWRVHDFNGTTEANFFSDEGMGVKTTFRTINFYEMIFTPSFFLQKRQEWTPQFNQATGKYELKLINVVSSNEDYRKLREAMLYEVYIFQLLRNGDFTYRMNMSGAKGMTQALQGIFKTNPITSGDYLERILSMPSMSRVALGEKEGSGQDISTKIEKNFIMGEATRTALTAYMYIWDFDTVRDLLGKDAPLFNKEYDKYDEYGVKQKERKKGGGSSYKEEWFDESGKLRDLLPKEKEAFMGYINLFLGPSRDQDQLKEIRERVVQSLMHKKGISYNEAKLAEAWAFALCRITGIAARNDTESVGFDQWTKQGNLESYRQRQISERRRAKFGSKYTMAHKSHKFGRGLKRVTLSLVEALRDERGRALYELIQGGQARRIDIENNPIKTDIDFETSYKADELGNFIFAGYNGVIKTQQELVSMGLGNVATCEVSDKGKVVFKTRDGKVVDPHEKGLRPIKGAFVFRDDQGNEVESLKGRVVRYELDQHANPTFYDNDGNIIDVGPYKSRVVERDIQRMVFSDVLLTQFTANVIEMSTEWYEFIIESKGFELSKAFKGYTSTGMPIIDTEVLNNIKDHIRKNITYSTSTWPGTDYTKKIWTWDGIKEGEVGYEEDPEKADANHEMSVLRSMFGDEPLAFIQHEIWSKKRADDVIKHLQEDGLSDKEVAERLAFWKSIDVWKLEDYHDSLEGAGNLKRELKICVWTGMFTYMIAKDIWKHRAIDSTGERWGKDEMRQAYDVLEYGGLMYEDEKQVIEKQTNTSTSKMFGQEFMQALGAGNLEGFWQMIQAMIKQQSLV